MLLTDDLSLAVSLLSIQTTVVNPCISLLSLTPFPLSVYSIVYSLYSLYSLSSLSSIVCLLTLVNAKNHAMIHRLCVIIKPRDLLEKFVFRER